MRIRSGVTLVEVLVALMVFSIAALGSAAALGISASAQATASARRQSLAALQHRAALFAGVPCDSLSNGLATVSGIPVSWSVTRDDSLARLAFVAAYRGVLTKFDTEVSCR